MSLATMPHTVRGRVKVQTFADQITDLTSRQIEGVSPGVMRHIVSAASTMEPLGFQLHRGWDFLSPSESRQLQGRMLELIMLVYKRARYYREPVQTVGFELAAFGINGLGYKYRSLCAFIETFNAQYPGSKARIIGMLTRIPTPDPTYKGPSR